MPGLVPRKNKSTTRLSFALDIGIFDYKGKRTKVYNKNICVLGDFNMDTPTSEQTIRIKARMAPGISLLSVVNEPLPCIVSLAIENLSDKGIKDLRLEISFDPAIGKDHTITFNYIGSKSTSLVSPNELKKLVLDKAYFASLSEKAEGTIHLKAYAEESTEPLSEENITIPLLPFGTWGGIGEIKYSHLASFVMPTMPVVKKMAIKAGDILRNEKKGTACGYQEDTQGVLDQTESVFKALQGQQLEYVDQDRNPQAGELVRLPEQTYREKKGTAIDLAVLFASVLEDIGLHSVLCLWESTALVGCFLEEDFFLANSIEDGYSHVQSLEQQGKLVLVEVKSLSNPILSFKEAVEKAKAILVKPKEFFRAIDVSICRDSGIFPLPLNYDTETGAITLGDINQYQRTHAHDSFDETILAPRESPASGFDIWERELLDLSMNNPLLNDRIKRSISFLCNDTDFFTKSFKDDDKFSIAQKPVTMTGEIDPLLVSSDSKYQALSESAIKSKKLISTQSDSDLQDRLKRIYRKYRDNLNETGSNTLYLTVGLLKYYEIQNQDNLGAYRLAPIVLIPVDIVRDVKGKSYNLRLRDEDWLLNTTLIEFLKKERNLDLYAIESVQPDSDGHLDVQKILTAFSKAIHGISGWYCYRNYLGLGSFDFTHYCMWSDLRNRRDQMERNQIVKSLATGRKEWSESTSTNPIKESDCCIPLVADSSQIEAIKKCADSKSFILFGPPGTGKSQTIVNMIANSLFHGKKVLFVSEKQAALDVVYNRLKRIGLDPFCLQLHSAKASKGSVLSQFSNAFKHAQLGSPAEYERTKEDIVNLRAKLEYDIEVFNRKAPCFLSINDALIGYESVKAFRSIPSFTDDFIRSMTEEKFKKINDVTERIAYLEAYGHFGEFYNNDLVPLRGHAYGLEKREQVGSAVKELLRKAVSLSGAVNKIKNTFRPVFSLTRENTDVLVAYLNAYLVPEAPHPLSNAIQDLSIRESEKDIRTFLEKLREYQEKRREKILPFLSPQALDDITLKDCYAEVKTIDLAGKLFHKSKSSKRAKKGLRKYLNVKIRNKDAVDLLATCIELQNLRNDLDTFMPIVRNVFREEFKSYDESDADDLMRQFNYSISLANSVLPIGEITQQKMMISSLLSFSRSISNINVNMINVFRSVHADFWKLAQEYREKLELDLSYLPDRYDFYSTLPTSLNKIQEKLLFAAEWANMNSAIDELKALDLQSAADCLMEGKVSCRDLGRAIDCNIYLGIALLSIRENNLESFSGLSEEATISKYNEECRRFRELSIAQLLSQLSENIPNDNSNASPTSELGFLKKAIASNGHGKSIRKILDGAINLIRTLCPCFLMSPMSAATYLSPDMAPFDVVIFDEASQIPTAEAVGPISRGKSLVVCGDSNQLPPTSFFKRDNSSENADFLTSSLPSILEECKAIMLPEQELRWHYRSRSESLIAFSNHEFYYDSLYTFPSIDDQVSMVKYCRVDSSYDRSHSRTNEEEAKAIVKEVLRRKNDPKLKKDSIGIVAFSQAQKDLIEDKLDDALTGALKDEDDEALEPIFVKNLENVQGDERDIIIFSIGYGMDRSGRMTMNFGPINGINGFRRLNVAISRARKEMLIYTNIDPDRYHDEDIDNPGAQYLFRFLRYAKHGRTALANSTRTTAKDEEVLSESIASELRKKGYTVHTGVGDSSFHLNLAIVDKDHPEDYLLGVMVEGEKGTNYHLTDKLQIQPQVLKSLGWKTIRVYALDWINSPSSVITEIEIAYKKAQDNKRASSYRDVYEKKEDRKNVPQPPVLKENKKRVGKGRNYMVPDYRTLDASKMNHEQILEQIGIVIRNEAPISERLLQKRITKIFGLTRLANRNKDEYDIAISQAMKKYPLTHNKDGSLFFWNEGSNPKKLDFYRNRNGNTERSINDIAKEEIAVAIYDVLMDQFGIDKEGLERQLLAYFSMSRDTGKYHDILEEAIDWAIENRTDFLTTGENGTLILK